MTRKARSSVVEDDDGQPLWTINWISIATRLRIAAGAVIRHHSELLRQTERNGKGGCPSAMRRKCIGRSPQEPVPAEPDTPAWGPHSMLTTT